MSNAFPELEYRDGHPVGVHPGLTKLEYAAIHLAAGMQETSNADGQLSDDQIARDAVNRATAVLRICEATQR